jgi:hypothetical protein
MAEPLNILAEHRQRIPAEVREEIKLRIVSAQIRGYDEFADCLTYIAAETLAGNIPVEVADSVRKYLELMLTTFVMRDQADKGTLSVKTSAYEKLAKANKEAKKMLPEFGAQATLVIPAKAEKTRT